MNTRAFKSTIVFLLTLLFLTIIGTSTSLAATMENLIFESASVSIGSEVDADFDASTNRNCSSIYVSSCTLQKKNASGTWVYAVTLTPPSDVARNTSDFGALADYSNSCTSGNTYRVRAVFKAVYNGISYTVTRTSNSVNYN
jgi:hypothetical protein